MNVVWLSFEEALVCESREVIGVSSTEDKARQVCQNREDNWGEGKARSPLSWGKIFSDEAKGYLRIYYVTKRVVDDEE